MKRIIILVCLEFFWTMKNFNQHITKFLETINYRMPEIFTSQAHPPTNCVYALKNPKQMTFRLFMHRERNFFISKTISNNKC